MSIPMRLSRRKRPPASWLFSVLLMLNGWGEEESIGASQEARNSVVKIISDDSNNKLVDYAVKNATSVAANMSNATAEAEKIAIREKARKGAVYRLDDHDTDKFKEQGNGLGELQWGVVRDR